MAKAINHGIKIVQSLKFDNILFKIIILYKWNETLKHQFTNTYRLHTYAHQSPTCTKKFSPITIILLFPFKKVTTISIAVRLIIAFTRAASVMVFFVLQIDKVILASFVWIGYQLQIISHLFPLHYFKRKLWQYIHILS